jgi:hypothetical protein
VNRTHQLRVRRFFSFVQVHCLSSRWLFYKLLQHKRPQVCITPHARGYPICSLVPTSTTVQPTSALWHRQSGRDISPAKACARAHREVTRSRTPTLPPGPTAGDRGSPPARDLCIKSPAHFAADQSSLIFAGAIYLSDQNQDQKKLHHSSSSSKLSRTETDASWYIKCTVRAPH